MDGEFYGTSGYDNEINMDICKQCSIPLRSVIVVYVIILKDLYRR